METIERLANLTAQLADMHQRQAAIVTATASRLLAAWFGSHSNTFEWMVRGQMMTGDECAFRLRSGDTFLDDYRVQGQGVGIPKARRR